MHSSCQAKTLLAVFAASCGALVGAQVPVTSPKGLDAVEGNAAFSFGNNRRMMVVDNTQGPVPLVITAFALRRNGPTTSGNGPGTMNIELYMGQGNYGVMSAEFDRNHVGTSKTLVHAVKPVNVPDWTQAVGSPAPFDFVVTLDQPYIHLGTTALVWDLTYSAGTVGSLSIDRDFGTLNSSMGATVGTACTSSGAAGPFTHKVVTWNTGAPLGSYGLTLQIGCSNAPANASIFMHLDVMARGITVPGLCGTIEALPVLTIPIGTSDGSGLIPDLYLSFPWDAALESSTFTTQLAALDPPQMGLPFSVSNGVNSSFRLGGAGIHQSAYLWAPLPAQYGTGNFVFTGGSPVVQLK